MKNTNRLKVRGWEKLSHKNGNENKAGVAILISDKINFKTNAIVRDKEGHHYLLIKGAVQQEDITPVNMYAPKYIKRILMDIKE